MDFFTSFSVKHMMITVIMMIQVMKGVAAIEQVRIIQHQIFASMIDTVDRSIDQGGGDTHRSTQRRGRRKK